MLNKDKLRSLKYRARLALGFTQHKVKMTVGQYANPIKTLIIAGARIQSVRNHAANKVMGRGFLSRQVRGLFIPTVSATACVLVDRCARYYDNEGALAQVHAIIDNENKSSSVAELNLKYSGEKVSVKIPTPAELTQSLSASAQLSEKHAVTMTDHSVDIQFRADDKSNDDHSK